MKVFTFTGGPINQHPYLVIDEKTKEGLVIDPGCCSDEIIDELAKSSASLRFIINTHLHPDHIAQNSLIADMTGAKILIHKSDAWGLSFDWSAFSKKYDWPVLESKPDKLLRGGEIIKLGSYDFKIIHTPGHTQGSICVFCPKLKAVFTGDTLFYHTIGRTDLPTSQPEKMQNSLAKLFGLPFDTVIYPGHGRPSTIGEEVKFNKYKSLNNAKW